MCGRGYYDILQLTFEFFAAIGTVGAVIVSLYILFDSKKIKYIMKDDTINLEGIYTKAIGVNVTLTSNSKDNLIKISSFPKMKIRKNNYMIFKPNLQEYDNYKIPKSLSYGDSLNFFFDQKQIELILKNRNKKFLFFFCDQLGHTYKIKINRNLFEKQYIKPKE